VQQGFRFDEGGSAGSVNGGRLFFADVAIATESGEADPVPSLKTTKSRSSSFVLSGFCMGILWAPAGPGGYIQTMDVDISTHDPHRQQRVEQLAGACAELSQWWRLWCSYRTPFGYHSYGLRGIYIRGAGSGEREAVPHKELSRESRVAVFDTHRQHQQRRQRHTPTDSRQTAALLLSIAFI
jgi:hypothetical protein